MPTKAKEGKTKTARKNKREIQTIPQLNRLSFNKEALLKNRKTVSFLGLIIILAVALLYVFKGVFVAALVNGEPITRLSVIKSLEKQSGKATLDNLITKKLILQEARKRNVLVNQSEIDSEIKKIEANLKAQGTTLDQALELQGMTRKQLNEEIRIQLSIQRMVSSNLKVSDKEVADFLTTNKEQFSEGITEAQMKNQAKEQIKQQKLQEKTQAFLADLQKKAKILKLVGY